MLNLDDILGFKIPQTNPNIFLENNHVQQVGVSVLNKHISMFICKLIATVFKLSQCLPI